VKRRILEGKTAVVHGGGGAIGSAVARAFAREGASVFLTGRTRARLAAVCADITRAGAAAECDELDALDEEAVTDHAARVVAKAGHIDISVNAVGIPHVQGPRVLALSTDDFMKPIAGYLRTNFVTAKAAASWMAKRRAGVILTLSTPGSRMAGTGFLGYGVTCAAVEALSRLLACDFGPCGVRVLCLQPHAIPEAAERGSHAAGVFEPVARAAGVGVREMLEQAAQTTLLRRLPTLDDVANTAVFLASEHAAAMTGTIANLSCGVLLD
jgi:NAD(P)-dependent dehydrogenase (short-subunit alcohol dehydrogenase family)